MKHCDNCDKDFDTIEVRCPVCGEDLQDRPDEDELDTDELVATMTITGIL